MLGENRRELVLLMVLLVSTFSTVALIGYDPNDPTWTNPGPGPVNNPCGPLGAYVADWLLSTFGYGAWLSFVVMVLAVLAIAGRNVLDTWRMVAGVLGGAAGLAMLAMGLGAGGPYAPGGAVGGYFESSLVELAGSSGAWLVVLGVFTLAVTVLFQIRWGRVLSSSMGLGSSGSRGSRARR